MGVIAQLVDTHGDVKVEWDKNNLESIAKAKNEFKSLLKSGGSFFSINEDGSTGKRVDKFDPELQLLIFIPQIAGG